jgi:xanthine dehydrogenase molybdopterin-binding subunit B
VLLCAVLQNRWRKRGLAVTPTKFGIAFTKLTYNQGGALVHVYTDGTVGWGVTGAQTWNTRVIAHGREHGVGVCGVGGGGGG